MESLIANVSGDASPATTTNVTGRLPARPDPVIVAVWPATVILVIRVERTASRTAVSEYAIDPCGLAPPVGPDAHGEPGLRVVPQDARAVDARAGGCGRFDRWADGRTDGRARPEG